LKRKTKETSLADFLKRKKDGVFTITKDAGLFIAEQVSM